MNAVFYIEDTSTNGTFINGATNRLTPGRPCALKSGDCILIDPYEIRVAVTSERGDTDRPPSVNSSERPSPAGQFRFETADLRGERGGSSPQSVRQPSSSRFDALAEAVQGELDPLKLLDPHLKPAPVREVPSAKNLAQGSALSGHYQPPAVLPVPPLPSLPIEPLIPEDYDPTKDDSDDGSLPPWTPSISSAPSSELPVDFGPPTSPFSPAAAPGGEDPGAEPLVHTATPQETLPAAKSDDRRNVDLAEVLEGVGLQGAAVTPELARRFGQILRVVVAGVMDVLRARQQIKDEFRMRMTHFKVADNNPLKFSANVEDALHNLLVKRNEAYLEPVAAFEDAFDDLRSHQIAMLAGMRVAFEFMLAEFDPKRLQDQFDRQIKRGALIGMPAKLQYWDLYCDRCQDMAKDPEVSFRKLFGEAFAKAYEEQLMVLKERRSQRG